MRLFGASALALSGLALSCQGQLVLGDAAGDDAGSPDASLRDAGSYESGGSSTSSSGGSSSGSGSDDASESSSSSGGSSTSSSNGSSSGSSTSSSNGSSSGVVDDAGPGYVSAQPPGPVASVGPGLTIEHTFAIHHFHIGDEPGDCANSTSWCHYGYDIDHLDTTATSTNVCTLAPFASRANQGDGPGGLDNSVGQNVVPLLDAVLPNLSQVGDDGLAAGTLTVMIDTIGIDESTESQTATGLQGQSFRGVAFNQTPNADSATPTFTTHDVWPVDPSYVSNPSTDGGVHLPLVSTQTFTSPYVTDGIFVSGTLTQVTITLPIQGAPLALPIRHAVITFQNNGNHAASGIISGVIVTSDLIDALVAAEGDFAPDFCPTIDGGTSAALEQIIVAIQQAADIMHDGTNAPGQACDAVSIGLGFDADEIGVPQVLGAPLTIDSGCGE